MKKIWLIFLALLATLTLAAQNSTRVRGVVTDAETGEPLPFVGVYFDGTSIGISTDLQGRYSLETKSPDAKKLTAQHIGYTSVTVSVSQGSFSEINFSLQPDPKQLSAARVRPNNRYIRYILGKLDKSLKENDPDNAPDWSSHLYSKIEIDVTNHEDLLRIAFLDKNLGFVREYADTSAITGKAFIPAMISENISDIYHSQDPSFLREVTRYNRISGVELDNAARQFTGSQLLRTNFFKPNLSVLNLDIPNPAAASSHLFYNYFLVDSLQVDGRKTYVLRFHPKELITSPTLDGEMQIDAEDMGIRTVHAALSRNSNVNWIRHLNFDIENRRTPEGRWFFADERLFIDFSVATNDASHVLSLLGRRQLTYEPPVYGPITDPDALNSTNTVVERHVKRGDDAFWEQARPYPLSQREQGIFDMVEDFQQTGFYHLSYDLLRTLFSGYYRSPQLGMEFGRWNKALAHNETEGLRLQLGGRTYHEFSEFVRLGGYLAYGFKDQKLKWQASAEFMFDRERTRKLTLLAKNDFVQFSSGAHAVTQQDMFSAILGPSGTNSQHMSRSFDILYDHEFCPAVNTQLEWTTERIWGNPATPFVRQDGTIQDSYSSNTLRAMIRLSKDERVSRSYFKKTYVYTKYPFLQLTFSGGIKGITPDDFSYLRSEALIYWQIPSNALGFGRTRVIAGAIWGSVPYTQLKLHEGNQSFFWDRSAFSCMDYYEFISDRWVSGYYEHNFNGLFLGKIPLIRKLDLREVATVRFAWGTLSDYNRGENAPFRLPMTAGTLEKPYVEVGIGLSNIFRVVRVDAYWRLTHRTENTRNFVVNVGFDVDF